MIPTALTCRRLAWAATAGVLALALSACDQKPPAKLATPQADASSAPVQPVAASQPERTAHPAAPAPEVLAEARVEPEAPARPAAPAKAESKPSLPKSPTAAGKPPRSARPIGDSELAAKVKSAVLAEPLSALLFNVNVANGVVTLSGTADTHETRDKAARAASGVEGVKSVNNKIAVISGS